MIGNQIFRAPALAICHRFKRRDKETSMNALFILPIAIYMSLAAYLLWTSQKHQQDA